MGKHKKWYFPRCCGKPMKVEQVSFRMGAGHNTVVKVYCEECDKVIQNS